VNPEPPPAPSPAPSPAYAAFFCEENIWHLCAHPHAATAERRVLFISNAERRVVMWGQRVATDPERPILWDYHVVLLLRWGAGAWQVWDLDARGSPLRPAREWLRDSFGGSELLPANFAPCFRMVEGDEYRRHLRSDRSHMRLADGTPLQPPPPWPEIVGEPPACAPVDDGSNLERFIDTEDPGFLGELFDLAGLRRWLARAERD
jgi:protein N-terminal glutamine amidohydrolase